jgi:hypothetical protein
VQLLCFTHARDESLTKAKGVFVETKLLWSMHTFITIVNKSAKKASEIISPIKSMQLHLSNPTVA